LAPVKVQPVKTKVIHPVNIIFFKCTISYKANNYYWVTFHAAFERDRLSYKTTLLIIKAFAINTTCPKGNEIKVTRSIVEHSCRMLSFRQYGVHLTSEFDPLNFCYRMDVLTGLDP
jgi:hypothetical protein